MVETMLSFIDRTQDIDIDTRHMNSSRTSMQSAVIDRSACMILSISSFHTSQIFNFSYLER